MCYVSLHVFYFTGKEEGFHLRRLPSKPSPWSWANFLIPIFEHDSPIQAHGNSSFPVVSHHYWLLSLKIHPKYLSKYITAPTSICLFQPSLSPVCSAIGLPVPFSISHSTSGHWAFTHTYQCTSLTCPKLSHNFPSYVELCWALTHVLNAQSQGLETILKVVESFRSAVWTAEADQWEQVFGSYSCLCFQPVFSFWSTVMSRLSARPFPHSMARTTPTTSLSCCDGRHLSEND